MAQEIGMGSETKATGPDLALGIPLEDLAAKGLLVGQVGGQAVLLVRRGEEVFAIGAECSHYHGPLGEGLVVEDTVRCPWHHACFSLRSGEALRAPALSPVACWRVEMRDGMVFVREKIEPSRKVAKPESKADKVVIVGGGAAGFAAAEMLRREGFAGAVTMLSTDTAPPYDRPNLSKDYLAGTAPEDWIPLRPADFYTEQGIDLELKVEVAGIDAGRREVTLVDGRTVRFDKLLLATGAEPVRLSIPGAGEPHVHTLRSLEDSRRIIADAATARRAVVIGASFIGLEVAAALRARGLEVHVVGPERIPFVRVLGPELGTFIRSLHEEHGVHFHLGESAVGIERRIVQLKSGTTLAADLVVVGIGVRPRTELAGRAGLAVDRGVVVDEYLETNAPGIFAAGDIARWPDRHAGEPIRVEHWVVAERQGQAAARNMLGFHRPFAEAPFFWSQHYDVPINYVGHAATWDGIEIAGDIAARDCLVRYRRNGRVLAAASIFRDLDSLRFEVAMEQDGGAVPA
jgi:NADPH-dependent 2,4-dienoyl-CoA reductase/sulfur reductase-like enzyme/nitrite reductase/ring-hydroxylating ferredoxin subunit